MRCALCGARPTGTTAPTALRRRVRELCSQTAAARWRRLDRLPGALALVWCGGFLYVVRGCYVLDATASAADNCRACPKCQQPSSIGTARLAIRAKGVAGRGVCPFTRCYRPR